MITQPTLVRVGTVFFPFHAASRDRIFMRLFSRVALPAVLVIPILSSAAQAQAADLGSQDAPAFSAQQLFAPPTSDWITNGGSLSNQRYSPDRQSESNQCQWPEGQLARLAERFGLEPPGREPGPAHRVRRRRLRDDGRRG